MASADRLKRLWGSAAARPRPVAAAVAVVLAVVAGIVALVVVSNGHPKTSASGAPAARRSGDAHSPLATTAPTSAGAHRSTSRPDPPTTTAAAAVSPPVPPDAAGGPTTSSLRPGVGGPLPPVGASQSALGPLPPPDPGWRSLATISGTGNGQSATFHLSGGDTQLRYRSASADLHIFLVDAARGLDATAGYAEVDCAQACADLMVLTDKAGTYYLMVTSGGGSWQATIEEVPRPVR